jgi:hypothetical protein
LVLVRFSFGETFAVTDGEHDNVANPAEGTLRHALAQVDSDDDVIDVQVDTVYLVSGLTYSTAHTLSISSSATNGTLIRRDDLSDSAFTISNGPRRVNLDHLFFLFINLTFDFDDATQSLSTGNALIDLDGVTSYGTDGNAGIAIYDSSSSYDLDVVLDNCTAELATGFGIWILTGNKALTVGGTNLEVVDNGSTTGFMDGLKIDHYNGDVFLYLDGYYGTGNLEDTIEIEQTGAGSVEAILLGGECEDKGEEDIDINEDGDGDLNVTIDGLNSYGIASACPDIVLGPRNSVFF